MNHELTVEELEVLYLIKAIADFDKENPGNIPAGGVGEVIVSNGVKEPEEFDKITDVLFKNGLTDADNWITKEGCEYLKSFESDLQEDKSKMPPEKLADLYVRLKKDNVKNAIFKGVLDICTILVGISAVIAIAQTLL